MSASDSFPSKPDLLGPETAPRPPGEVIDAVAVAPPITPLQVISLVAPLALVGVIYLGTFLELIKVWDEDANYSHGFVVPFFALGLGAIAYLRDGILPFGNEVTRRSVILGSVEIAIGFVLHLLAMFLGRYIGLFLDVAALIFMLRGIMLAIGGPKANASYGFPILFLIFMAPLPPQVYDPIALQLQGLAAIVATNLLELVGIPALREGYMIHIPEYQLEVAGECSGMRSLTAMLALAMAIGFISGRGQAYRWILGLLAAPVAIAINCVRVFATGVIMLNFGPQWATGTAHALEGMVGLGVAAALLAGVAWLLAVAEDTYLKPTPPAAAPVEAKLAEPAAPA